MAEIKNDSKSRTWFLTLNNPKNYAEFEGCVSPESFCERAGQLWIKDHPDRACAIRYCISADGLHHLHIVAQDKNQVRFSGVKSCYPTAHIEPAMGNKSQVLDYINKLGKWEEKGEEIKGQYDYGDIVDNQGKNNLFVKIQELLEQGYRPDQIVDELGFAAQRYIEDIKSRFLTLRGKSISKIHENIVIWHTGKSGSGKSYYCYKNLVEKYGEDEVYFISDTENAFDEYLGEKVLVIDEYRRGFKYMMLLKMLDIYKFTLPCRYHNKVALWNETHITSVLSPEDSYKLMVSQDERQKDSIEQLYRRITEVWVHEKVDGEYKVKKYSMDEYKRQVEGWHHI